MKCTMPYSHRDKDELLQRLEQLEALLICAISADLRNISPASQKSLFALAHEITCAAIEASQAQRQS